MQEGEGKCINADGSQYDGQWKAGLRWGLLSCFRPRDGACACSKGLVLPCLAGMAAGMRAHSGQLYV